MSGPCADVPLAVDEPCAEGVDFSGTFIGPHAADVSWSRKAHRRQLLTRPQFLIVIRPFEGSLLGYRSPDAALALDLCESQMCHACLGPRQLRAVTRRSAVALTAQQRSCSRIKISSGRRAFIRRESMW